ncbi:MAG: UTP--glucose-1-phosphate uridylyltransferase [Thermodesulfobacteriota bacterium]|nr:UTP--glucose-1-phosphate uridylyltransferase [Thermodesulfobacteriota bacterium]
MTKEQIINFLRNHNQQHILDHYHWLSPEGKNNYLKEWDGLDLALVFDLHKKLSPEKDFSRPFYEIHPAPIITIPETAKEKAQREEARVLGESLIRKNQVAVLIVAGGQGSRLGFEGPKGKFLISPVKKKSLFQLFAESVQALSNRYRSTIPLLIMTNQENQLETRQFFASHDFFNLKKETVFFFNQGMLPTLTPEGQFILQEDGHLLLNPDGHGGSLKALYESGLLKHLIDHGYAELFYCQVDNPLVKIADPVFIGYHRMEQAEISTKVVRRRDLKEKVGIYGSVNSKPTIVEYSDFRPEDYEALDENGDIRHWAGNTAIHMISLAFIKHLNQHGFALPYHRAVKEVEGLGPDGRLAKITGWKFETFVFDAIPLARKSCCMEVSRDEEFSPVKNMQGNDSPDTARAAMNKLYRSWLLEAGLKLSPEAKVEISPLFAQDKEELIEKLKGKSLAISGDMYIGQ